MPGVIKINPDVMNDKRDAMAVAVNEALRIAMEDLRFSPKSELTAEQRKLLAGTAYAGDEAASRKTVIARVATFDSSVAPTPEQKEETVQFLTLLSEALGPQHPDAGLVGSLIEAQKAGGLPTGNIPAEAAPEGGEAPAQEQAAPVPEEAVAAEPAAAVPVGGQSAGTPRDDMLGGNVAETAPKKQSWSAAAVDLIRNEESFRSAAYPDPPGQTQTWSIGYGTRFRPGQQVAVRRGDRISEQEARAYRAAAIQYNIQKLQESIGPARWEGLTGAQKAAMTSWAYNVGEKNVRGSTLARRFKAGEKDAMRIIREELPKWRSDGLTERRRKREVEVAGRTDIE